MMGRSDIIQALQKLKREQPRNPVVQMLWDSINDEFAKAGRKPLTRAEIQRNYRERKKAKNVKI